MGSLAAAALAAAAAVFDVPLLGAPPTEAVIEELGRLPGVVSLRRNGDGLRFEMEPRALLRLQQVKEAIRRHTVKTEVDYDRIPLTRRSVFQLDAGQCFNCTEGPLRQRLDRREWVSSWSVVDFAARGRMRIRIEPNRPTTLSELGPLPFEDLLLTDRYDAVDQAELYWRTGGIAWRPSEEVARREARETKKPLFIFPTAGT
jgi:hypothetical protein